MMVLLAGEDGAGVLEPATDADPAACYIMVCCMTLHHMILCYSMM